MRRALELARLGMSHVSPNPMVGAVIVCNGLIIGEGYHRAFGSEHAEVNAINSVADQSLLPKSTLYVTLEPCSHYGKTPPCCNLIIDRELKRVVVGTLDPNEKVSGRGVKKIQNAGIEVTVGVLERECRDLNAHFMAAHILRRPYVLLKWAQTADRVIGYRTEDNKSHSICISNDFTQMLVHRERSLFDAILVGARTYLSDNPRLDVRYWYARKNPIRIVFDPNASLMDHFCKNYPGMPVVWAVKESCCNPVWNDIENLTVLHLDDDNMINSLLSELFAIGVTSLMVEGGAFTLSQFLKAGLYDEIRIEQSLVKSDIPRESNPIYAPEPIGVLINVERHFKNIILKYVAP